MTDYRVLGGGYPPDYEDGDPRSWRNECESRTLKLEDFLNEDRRDFQYHHQIYVTRMEPNIVSLAAVGEKLLQEPPSPSARSVPIHSPNVVLANKSHLANKTGVSPKLKI